MRNIGALHNNKLGARARFVQSLFLIKAIGLTYVQAAVLLHSNMSGIILLWSTQTESYGALPAQELRGGRRVGTPDPRSRPSSYQSTGVERPDQGTRGRTGSRVIRPAP